MKPATALLCLLLVAGGCSSGPRPPALDKANVREALRQYAAQDSRRNLLIHTSFGNIAVTLYDDTPLHRANFLRLVSEGYYDRAEFYRVVPGFAIQGGDKTGRKEDFLIPAEMMPTHFHKKGALAMARFDEGNPGMASTPTEFYLVQGTVYTEADLAEEAATYHRALTPALRQAYTTVGGDLSLDGKYTVFGEVTSGLDVVDKIAAVKVFGERPAQRVPFTIEALP